MEFYAALARWAEQGEPFVLATVVEAQGSTPQKPGAKLALSREGLIGTIGGGAIEKQVVDAARELLADPQATSRVLETHLTHDLGMCCGGKMSVFLERQGEPAQLWVFGAGHVAKELAALARGVGFRVTVVDERSNWATPERFPGCTVLLAHPADVARQLEGGPQASFAVMTHDHPLDQACVEALLGKRSAYLGVIGSQRKAARFRLRLRAAGYPPEQLDRLECPMGVPLGALTPAEIGISIVARLIAVRRAQPRARPTSSAARAPELTARRSESPEVSSEQSKSAEISEPHKRP